jgi:UDP-N-acetylglucosamine/UDP-N-acetylgalactosamine diphosphorylase
MEAIKQALHLGKSNDAPAEPSPEALNELKEKYTKAGQEQVFTFYDSLSSA